MVKYLPMFTSTVYIKETCGCGQILWHTTDKVSQPVMSGQHPWKLSWHTLCVMLQTMSWLNREFPAICSLSVIQLCEWGKNRFQSLSVFLCEAHFFFLIMCMFLHARFVLTYLSGIKKKRLSKCNRCHLLNNSALLCSHTHHLIWVKARACQFGRNAATAHPVATC